jgi:hypothetical protein
MRRVAVTLLLAALAFTTSVANADAERVKFLASKLTSDDFRVRTNAALALGATNEESAVVPLCLGLLDTSEVVRQAAAVAMKRLARTNAVACLNEQLSVEKNADVRVAIGRAVEALALNRDSDAIKENPSAKYYVAVAIANTTGRSDSAAVDSMASKSMRAKLEAAGAVQLAPRKETPDAARSAIKKRKMNGFYLSVAIDRFDYSNGNLRVKVKIAIFSYPAKSLLGNFEKTVTKEGVPSADKASEDELIDVAAGLAGEQFVQNASAFL